MSDTLGRLAPHFFQVSYVVRDLASAERWFQRILGVPSFLRLDDVKIGADGRYRGRPADFAMDIALGYARETQVELIQPTRGASLYTEFLERKGPGLHHLGFAVPEYDAMVAELRESGLEVIAEGRSGGTDFAYFDCEADGASVIELVGFDEASLAMMEQLKRDSLSSN